MVQLTRRNTRRYGGYIVHFGVVIVIIGFAGAAFNQDKEQEMGYGDKMADRPLHAGLPLLHPGRQAQLRQRVGDLDVYKNGKQIDTMYPERRFYKASEQTATIVANRSTMLEDLYLVYAGKNPDTQRRSSRRT